MSARIGVALAMARALAQNGKSARPPDPILFEQPKTQWRNYPATMITPERYWRILRDADIGYLLDYMELLDDVAAHYQVASLLETRKLAVAGAPVDVDPPDGDSSDFAKEIAEAYEAFLKRIPRRVEMWSALLDCTFRSFSLVQPHWEALDAKTWQIVGHFAIEGRYCSIDAGQLLVQTARSPGGEPVPEGMLLHTHQNMAGNIIRSGTGRTLSRLWLWSSYAAIDGVSFLERFAHPVVLAKSSFREGSTELERLKDACEKLIVDQVGLIGGGACRLHRAADEGRGAHHARGHERGSNAA